MHVAVSIVGFRNPKDIAQCIDALKKSTYQDFEIVICENGGAEHFATLVATLPAQLETGQKVRAILAPGNLGYGGGVNLCMNQSQDADAWWVLNPDTQTTPGAMQALVERLLRGDCDAVGGPVYLDDETVQSYGGHWQAWSGRASSIGRDLKRTQKVDPAGIEMRQNYLNGASMLIGRKFLQTVGPMREDYFLYCEEVEWFLRARSHGMKLGFAPDGAILHHQGTTTGGNAVRHLPSRLAIYLGQRNTVLMTRDLFPQFLPSVLATSLAQLFARSRRLGGWRGVRHGLSGLFAGLRNKRGTPDWMGAN